jgi:hypothetical protein
LHDGFMDSPSVPEGLRLAHEQAQLSCGNLSKISYYIGRETMVPTERIPGNVASPASMRSARQPTSWQYAMNSGQHMSNMWCFELLGPNAKAKVKARVFEAFR